MLSVVGIKLVPLFKSSMMSGGRLMSVNLCNSLVDVSFSSSASSCHLCIRLESISKRRAVFCCQKAMVFVDSFKVLYSFQLFQLFSSSRCLMSCQISARGRLLSAALRSEGKESSVGLKT